MSHILLKDLCLLMDHIMNRMDLEDHMDSFLHMGHLDLIMNHMDLEDLMDLCHLMDLSDHIMDMNLMDLCRHMDHTILKKKKN